MAISKQFEQTQIDPSLYRLAGKQSKPVTGWDNYTHQRKLQIRLKHLTHAHNSLLKRYYDLQKENEELKDICNDIIETFNGIDDSKIGLWSENQDIKEQLDKLEKDIEDRKPTKNELCQMIEKYRNDIYYEKNKKTLSIAVNILLLISIVFFFII